MNRFHHDFQPFPSPETSQRALERGHYSLKGGSLRTQPSLGRPNFRNQAPPAHRHLFAGARLVLPPA